MSNISTGMTFNTVSTAIGNASSSIEATLRQKITDIQGAENVTTAQMLDLQAVMQQWTMMTQVQSTVVKELGDTLKGVIQKAA
ncbi:hypothetical protein SDC9_63693 [bioreactor metagenome]|uniref:Type III secretion protein n=1 Tax=bioreactor metagenome TaxID=1076179 RepID=A0A644XMC6_9ZZZZ